MSQSFTFIPGAVDNAPAAPAAPAQPTGTLEQIGGMTRFSFGVSAPKGEDIPNPDAGVPVDAEGHVRIRTSNVSNVQSVTFTPESGNSTSFVDAAGLPASPNEATHCKIPRGDGTYDLTSVGAAEAIGLIVKGPNGNYQATGRALRGGQVLEPHQVPAALQRDTQQARMVHVMNTVEAMRNLYGEAEFNKMVDAHKASGGTLQSFVAAALGQPQAPAADPNDISQRPPAIRPLTEAELAARRPAPAPVDPAANVPSHIDVRVAPLAAKEAALVEGANPSAVQALKASMAAAVASGDENTLALAARAYAMETGCSETKAKEVVQAIGHNIGAPIKTLAARVGVQPTQLLGALQQFDAEALGAALSQVATTRNGSKLVELTHRALAAHQQRRAK